MTLWQVQEVFDGYAAAHGAKEGLSEQEESDLFALATLPVD
jgi:hypothetical protein